MFDNDHLSIDCATCIGSATTACNDCIVTHLLANDAGPIGYVPIELTEVPRLPTQEELAVDMLLRAGLLGPTPQFVPVDEFEAAGAVSTGFAQI